MKSKNSWMEKIVSIIYLSILKGLSEKINFLTSKINDFFLGGSRKCLFILFTKIYCDLLVCLLFFRVVLWRRYPLKQTNNIILYDVYIIRLLIYYAKFILLVFIQLDHGGKTFMISTNTNLQYNLCRLRQDLKNY